MPDAVVFRHPRGPRRRHPRRRGPLRAPHGPTDAAPARAYLAVVEERAIVGECDLGAPTRRSAQGRALPITKPRRYRVPRALSEFGLAKVPRSFRYVEG